MQMLKINKKNISIYPSNDILDESKLDIAQAALILKKLIESWSRRAQVRKININEKIQFIEDAEDYLVDLLPFKDHPIFLKAPEDTKRKILSCGWVIYNQKTIAIETEIINPVCVSILSDKVPGVNDPISKEIVSETMVDESYHVLLVMSAINITCQRRNISLKTPAFSLIQNMKKLQSQFSSSWEKTLIQLATAIVSEIFISDYLKLLSENETIQPINRFTTKIHREDELAHSNIFKNLTKYIYTNLNKKEKKFFAEILAKPVQWFADRELDVWQSVLEQIGFENALKMIKDCKHSSSENLNYIDYSELISLANEIGVMNIPIGFESFYNEGLTN